MDSRCMTGFGSEPDIMKQKPWGPFPHFIQDAIKRSVLARNRKKQIKKTLFSERLHALRKASGLTMVTLAEKTGVTASYISLLESGERQPSKEMVQRLADIFFESDNLAAREELMSLAGIQLSPVEQQMSVLQSYERALTQNPQDFHVLSSLVHLLIRQRDFEQAERYILAGMKRFQDAWQLQMLMAQLQLSLDNYAMAALAQHKAIEIYEDTKAIVLRESTEIPVMEEQIDLYSNLGSIYFLWGMRDFQLYSRAVVEEMHEKAKQLAANCQKYFCTAQSIYQQAMQLCPEDVFLLNEYARICFNIADLSPVEQQTEKWNEAIQQLSNVLNAPKIGMLGISKVREASVFLAHAHSKSRRFEEAHHLLSVMQACHPNEWLPHYARVSFYSLRAAYYAEKRPKGWKQEMESDLDAGISVLAQGIYLCSLEEFAEEYILGDKDLLFLRKHRGQIFYEILGRGTKK